MAYIYYNPNPDRVIVGDCVIRGISLLMDRSWEEIYISICNEGLFMHDMPSSNEVWGSFLLKNGYIRKIIPNVCPECYTIKEFCADYPYGKFLLATGTHVVAVKNGNYYDTWDSGNEIPIYYFKKEEI